MDDEIDALLKVCQELYDLYVETPRWRILRRYRRQTAWLMAVTDLAAVESERLAHMRAATN